MIVLGLSKSLKINVLGSDELNQVCTLQYFYLINITEKIDHILFSRNS
jgi:hypothetical protein